MTLWLFALPLALDKWIAISGARGQMLRTISRPEMPAWDTGEVAAPEHNEVKHFAEVAEEYCTWAEGPPGDATDDARRARRLLIELLRCAIDLTTPFSEVESRSVSNDEYKEVYARFGTLPFNYYSECFNPLLVPPEEPVVADLADDLADIWRDVKVGLILWYELRAASAAWYWRFTFETHWGHHASAALYALQSWFAEHVNCDE